MRENKKKTKFDKFLDHLLKPETKIVEAILLSAISLVASFTVCLVILYCYM